MNHCVSKRLKAFLETFETRFANLILVFLETSGSPMDPEPHDWILSRPFLQGSTSGVSGSESNVDHDVRKPLVCCYCISMDPTLLLSKDSRSPLIPCNARASSLALHGTETRFMSNVVNGFQVLEDPFETLTPGRTRTPNRRCRKP